MLKGLTTGAVATVPFTAIMFGGKYLFPAHEARAVPPKQITARIVDSVSPVTVSEPSLNLATTFAHFGYGAMTGAIFESMTKSYHGNKVVAGVAFGVGVWALSYMGWLPSLGLQPSITRQPRGRNVTMIAAHLQWGAVIGYCHRNHRVTSSFTGR